MAGSTKCFLIGIGCLAAGFLLGSNIDKLKTPLRSEIAANESAAVDVLRFCSQRLAPRIRNSNLPKRSYLEMYWTVDWYGLFHVPPFTKGGLSIVTKDIAWADRFPSPLLNDPRLRVRPETLVAARRPLPQPVGGGFRPRPGRVSGRTLRRVRSPLNPIAFHGYYFEALLKDENGNPYASDEDGDGNIWENSSKFGFRAIPAIYGVSGVHTFQINEAGVLYGRDLNSGAESRPSQGNWEGGEDPSAADPPWRIVG